MDFKDKKVLVFGFGILGGGLATTNWLLKQGARVTVTDLKTKEQLKTSLDKINGQVELKLGGHSEADIDDADIIVLNQDVALKNKYVQYAFGIGKPVETEGTIFFKLFLNRIVGITGTRGKTTTTAWTNAFLKTTYSSSTVGNTGAENPFLEIVDRHDLDIVAAEIPSYQLEFFHLVDRTPEIAIITNISPDHLNRHGTIEGYALAKGNIFKKQTSEQHLILNARNEWTKFYLRQKSEGKVWLFSTGPMKEDGLFHDKGSVFLQKNGKKNEVLSVSNFAREKGEHNLENLLASALAAHLAGVSWKNIQDTIPQLPQIKFRQEVIYKDNRLTVINDTTATSPEGGIQALKRFGNSETILITGGTDKDLDFTAWAKIVPEHIQSGNIVFLSGSATDKMRALLEDWAAAIPILNSLEECVQWALKKAGQYPQSVILFSPASKSFEKFKNEYDRGEQFNELIKKYGH